MEFEFLVDGVSKKVVVEEKKGLFQIKQGDIEFEADVRRLSDNELTLVVGGRSHEVLIARDKDREIVYVGGRQYVLREPGEAAGRSWTDDHKGPGGGLKIKAPMPGKVIKVLVAEGEAVRKNQTLIIVEAMKMENEIKSSLDGSVKKIHVAAGELVDPERLLLELEAN